MQNKCHFYSITSYIPLTTCYIFPLNNPVHNLFVVIFFCQRDFQQRLCHMTVADMTLPHQSNRTRKSHDHIQNTANPGSKGQAAAQWQHMLFTTYFNNVVRVESCLHFGLKCPLLNELILIQSVMIKIFFSPRVYFLLIRVSWCFFLVISSFTPTPPVPRLSF